MDTAKWPQEFVVKPMNEIVTNTCLKQPINPPPASSAPEEKKTRPEKDLALNCPRCNSLNTKFCYYNNYSLTQPRYFCKDCRRYWTEGGSLRNIPIGGGIRKNKRSSSSSSPSSSSSKKALFLNNTPPPPPPLPDQLNPKIPHDPKLQELGFGGHVNKDLNLAFVSQGFGISIPEFLPTTIKNNPSLVSTSSALELLGISSSSNTRPPPPPPFIYPNVHDHSYTASGFGLTYPHHHHHHHHQFQDFMRPALGFSLDAAASAYGGDPSLHQQQQGSTTTTNNNGRPLLQFESLKLPVSSSSTNSGNANANVNDNHHSDDDKDEGAAADQSAGFWNGMLSAGSGPASASGSWQ